MNSVIYGTTGAKIGRAVRRTAVQASAAQFIAVPYTPPLALAVAACMTMYMYILTSSCYNEAVICT